MLKLIMKNKTKRKLDRVVLTTILLGIGIFLTLLLGCTTNRQPEFTPLPPERLFDNLLHENGLQNIAYKSVTEKDYKDNDDDC